MNKERRRTIKRGMPWPSGISREITKREGKEGNIARSILSLIENREGTYEITWAGFVKVISLSPFVNLTEAPDEIQEFLRQHIEARIALREGENEKFEEFDRKTEAISDGFFGRQVSPSSKLTVSGAMRVLSIVAEELTIIPNGNKEPKT